MIDGVWSVLRRDGIDLSHSIRATLGMEDDRLGKATNREPGYTLLLGASGLVL